MHIYIFLYTNTRKPNYAAFRNVHVYDSVKISTRGWQLWYLLKYVKILRNIIMLEETRCKVTQKNKAILVYNK